MLVQSILFHFVIRVACPGLPLLPSSVSTNRLMQHPSRPSTQPEGSRQQHTTSNPSVNEEI